jgi:L-fucose isomerase-like protein
MARVERGVFASGTATVGLARIVQPVQTLQSALGYDLEQVSKSAVVRKVKKMLRHRSNCNRFRIGQEPVKMKLLHVQLA